jgi:nitroreductase
VVRGSDAGRYRVMLVSSSGGVLLDVLALRPWWADHEVSWAAVRAADTEAALSGQEVTWVPEVGARQPIQVLAGLVRALRMIRRQRPDVIVSAGSGAAVPFFLAARLSRTACVWIDTLNLTHRRGLAARLCARLAGGVLVQQPGLAERYPHALYLGELY